MSTRKNILVTSAGKRVELVKAIKNTVSDILGPDVKVFTTDMNPIMAPAGYVSDKCIKVPRVTDESYPQILRDICDKYSIGLLIPTIDTELLLLSVLYDEFKAHGTHIAISDTSLNDTTSAFQRRLTKTIRHFLALPNHTMGRLAQTFI